MLDFVLVLSIEKQTNKNPNTHPKSQNNDTTHVQLLGHGDDLPLKRIIYLLIVTVRDVNCA